MGSFHGVAFQAESNHHHIPLLIYHGSAVGIDRRFDLGIVCGNPRLHELMDLRECGGIIDGFGRVELLGGEWDKVDGQAWIPSRIDMKGRIPRGAMDGGVVGKFSPR